MKGNGICMENDKIIRLLKANEIECRVSTINEKGLSLLLYKDARVDQRILDETFGVYGWTRSHQMIGESIYCTVSIYNEKTGEWISKQDVGTSAFTEKEKSLASDSFKRACFCVGIGRELYSAPFIWISSDKVKIQQRGDKFYSNEHFIIKEIAYNENREITYLSITDSKGNTLYQYGQQKDKMEELSKEQMGLLQSELKRTGVTLETVKQRYQVEKPEKMSEALYNKVMKALEKTQSEKAA